MKKLALLILTLFLLQTVKAEDGHQLWLRYQPVNKAKVNGPVCLAADQLHTYFQGDEATLVIDPTMADDA
ncbi:MAG: alpha-glucuronidase, partial [Prevotella sp.]|nr:alpha-glucuronidase [Prevotella sp.]